MVRLPVHLEGRQNVYFAPGQAEEQVQNRALRLTKLTQFFVLNATDVAARQYQYQEIPTHYTWRAALRSYSARRIRMANFTLARMYVVNPLDRNRFHLRLLLLKRRGPQSFEDIKTVDGAIHETFMAAAIALGLLEDDQAWRDCLTESATVDAPRQLRYLFVIILVFYEPSNPLALYEVNEANRMEDSIGVCKTWTERGPRVWLPLRIYSVYTENRRATTVCPSPIPVYWNRWRTTCCSKR